MSATLTTLLRPLRVGDLVVFAALLVAASYPLWHQRSVGTFAQVSWPGGEQQVDLRTDSMHTIGAPLGTYQLQVEQGRIRIRQAPCPHGYCVTQGWRAAPAQGPLVCVPGGLVVRIMGPAADSSVDAISR